MRDAEQRILPQRQEIIGAGQMAKNHETVREPVTIWFKPPQLSDLRRLAEQEERSLSAQLRLLVARGLAAEYEENE
jgi:hypothetical protein